MAPSFLLLLTTAALLIMLEGSAGAATEPRVVSLAAEPMTLGVKGSVFADIAAQGNENAIGFSLSFDSAVLHYDGVRLGTGASQAVLNVNDGSANSGRLGFALALPPGQVFSAGQTHLLELSFTPVSTSGSSTVIQFADTPVAREISDASANVLTAVYQNGTVNFNHAPTISSISNLTIDEDSSSSAIAFTISDLETPAGQLQLTAHSSNAALVPDGNIILGGSSGNRTITLTPLPNASGLTTITLQVSDGTLSTSTTFGLRVNAVNDSPSISFIPNQRLNEGETTGQISFFVDDVESSSDSLSVNASTSNGNVIPISGIQFFGSGSSRSFTITAGPNSAGTAQITFEVSDGQGSTTTAFQVTVDAVNHPPQVGPVSDLSTDEDTPIGPISVQISDDKTPVDSLRLSIASSNLSLFPLANLELGGSGSSRTLRLIPVADQSGSAVITIRANDGELEGVLSFTVVVRPINDPPSITAIPDQSIDQDNVTPPIAFQVADAESPANQLKVSPSSSNPTLIPSGNVVFSGSDASRSLIVIPAANQSGQATITLEVSDGAASSTTSFNVVVRGLNRPPVILSPGSLALNEDQDTVLNGISLHDPDAATAPVQAAFVVQNGRLHFGKIDGLSIVDGANDTVRVVLGGSLDALNAALGELHFVPAENFNGRDTLQITVNDLGNTGAGGPLSATKSIDLTVNPVNDLPSISPIADIHLVLARPSDDIPFQVGDSETPAESLRITVQSSDEQIVPVSGVQILGTGAQRKVNLGVPLKAGAVTIKLIVDDGQGGTAATQFLVNVDSVPIILRQSPSRSVLIGSDVTFEVEAAGSEPLQYQWKRDGTDLPGATESKLTLPKVSAADAGLYLVDVKNAIGAASSVPVRLTVNLPVTIVQEPDDQTVPAGGTARFSVVATGTEPLHYQWRFNGLIIPSATESFLIVSNVAPVVAGTYAVDVDNVVGKASSREARLTVNVQPSITRQPENQAVVLDGSANFQVGANGTEPLSFQWQFQGQDISGETKSTLSLKNVQESNAGDYTVIVRNASGEIRSNPAHLAVIIPTQITEQPSDLLVKEGSTATLSVKAAGSEPITYQWYFGGKEISGAQQPTFQIQNVQLVDDGSYSVSVRNEAGADRSREAKLSVSVTPVIRRAPESRTVLAGQSTAFEVVVSGTDPLSYQWLFKGIDLPGQTSRTLVLDTVQPASAGDYQVRVSNFAGEATSPAARLTVNEPVVITQQPVPQAVTLGGDVTFTVVATGSGPLNYQWLYEGQPVSGQTTPTLTLSGVKTSDAGSYSVLVSNAAGAATSDSALLTVNVPVRIVAQPADMTVRLSERAQFEVVADGTPPLTYQWKFKGVDLPGENNSVLVLNSVRADQAGAYSVVVRNPFNIAPSANAALTVLLPPTLGQLPASQRVQPGSDVTLTIPVQDQGQFQFQWMLNGVNLTGATGPSLALRNVQARDSGTYSVVVAGPGGATTSQSTALIVDSPSLAMADNFSAAVSANQSSATFLGSNVDATAETGEPDHSAGRSPSKSVWFNWVAPSNGIVDLDTAGSGFDTVLAVYTGNALNALTPVARDEDSGGFLTSALTFNAIAGTTYHIAIDGFDGASGHIIVSWTLSASAVPLPVIRTQPVSQTVLIDQSASFTVLAESAFPLTYQWFHDGNLVAGATNPALILSRVAVSDVGTYTVLVKAADALNPNSSATVESDGAELQLNLTATGDEGPDIFVQNKFGFLNLGGNRPVALHREIPAQSIARGFTGGNVFSTKSAIKEPGEPNHCGVVGGASAWLLYEPVTNGVARISTEGSDFDTILAVYTGPGTDFKSLVLQGCDNDSGSDGKSSVVVFPATVGTQYFVVVDGVRGAKGNVQLKHDLAAPPVITQQPTGQKITTPFALDGFSAGLTATPIGSFNVGEKVQLSASAANRLANVPLTFQWRKNGLILPGQTSASLTFNPVQATDGGAYTVEVSNFAGPVLSQAFQLSVGSPPEILQGPQSVSAATGDQPTFSVIASGTSPLRYQWSFNGQPVPRAIQPTFTVQVSGPAEAGTYSVQVSNGGGTKTASAVLTVSEAPVIVTQPGSQRLAIGSDASFDVTATGSALTYQWRFKGVDLPGQNSARLTVPNVQPESAGDYTVVVGNAIRSVVSSPAVLDVTVPITITGQPQPISVVAGGIASFSVTASGSAPLSYQWKLNGTDVANANGPTYSFTAQPAQVGSYQVVVTNPQGQVSSGVATLTVITPPTITGQPQPRAVAAGQDAAFTVTASGGGNLRYQWQFNGADIPGAIASTYAISKAAASQAGTYLVVVSNEAGSTVSSPAQLTVITGLVITQQPQDQAAAVQSTVRFNVTATGSPPLRFQWRHGGTPIAGATSSALVLTGIQNSDAGNYDVVVSNDNETATSTAAKLTVTAEQPLQIASGKIQTGKFRLELKGPLGQKFQLESSTDLVNWTAIGPVTFDTSESAAFEDAVDTQAPGRFYRMTSVP